MNIVYFLVVAGDVVAKHCFTFTCFECMHALAHLQWMQRLLCALSRLFDYWAFTSKAQWTEPLKALTRPAPMNWWSRKPLERRTCEDHDLWSCFQNSSCYTYYLFYQFAFYLQCLVPVRYLRVSPGCMCAFNWTVLEHSPDLEGRPPNWTLWSLSQTVSLTFAWIYSESQGALVYYIQLSEIKL